MKTTWRRPLLVLCCLLIALAPAASVAETAAEASAAPQVIDLLSANTKLDLTPYRGTAILINFFTSWCAYCMEEMPDIKAVYDAYSEDDLQIVLVHVWDGEDASHSETVRKTYGLEDLTFFEDEDMSLSAFVGLQGYPASLFVAKDGTLAAAMNYMLTYEAMEKQLEALQVEKKAVAE